MESKSRSKHRVLSLADTQAVAGVFSEQLSVGDIVALYGDLGAGKTEFVRAVCRKLGVKDNITSPSFTIINQYESDFATIYHIDLYRISKKEELFEIGFYELFEQAGALFFIEWPEHSFGTLPFISHKIEITRIAEEEREIVVS